MAPLDVYRIASGKRRVPAEEATSRTSGLSMARSSKSQARRGANGGSYTASHCRVWCVTFSKYLLRLVKVVASHSTVCPWVRTNLFSRMLATVQSPGLSMCGNMVLLYWFALTLRASCPTRHAVGVSLSFRDYALCPKQGSSASGGSSCTVRVVRLQGGYVQYERATTRFNRLVGACGAGLVESK